MLYVGYGTASTPGMPIFGSVAAGSEKNACGDLMVVWCGAVCYDIERLRL